MDKIKGLSSGFFHTWECGNSAHRTNVFKQSYKEYVDKGMFIRDIQSAPRDARYKIDHYYREDTTESYTVPYPYLNFYTDVLKNLNIDETFNWKKELVDNQSEYTYGDITIGYKEFKYQELYPDMDDLFDDINDIHNAVNIPQFYFKYKGDINTLDFRANPILVDYSEKFWKQYKDVITTYNDVSTLLHNIRYFMQYKNLLNL